MVYLFSVCGAGAVFVPVLSYLFSLAVAACSFVYRWVLASFRSVYRSLYRYVFVPFSLSFVSLSASLTPLLSTSMTIKNGI